jgi:hypothetical protein
LTSASAHHAGAVPILRPWWFLVVATCVAAALVTVYGAQVIFEGGTAGLLAGVALVGLTAWPLILRLRVDRLDALGLYGLVSLALFGLTSLFWLGTPVASGPGLGRDDIAPALLVVALGLGFFAIGARLTGRPTPRRHPTVNTKQLPSGPALVIAYSTAATVVAVSLALGLYGYISQPGGQGLDRSGLVNATAGLSSLVVLATALTYFMSNTSQLKRVLVAIAAVQIALGLVAGFKGQTLEPLLFILLAYIATRRRVPWAAIGAVGALTLVVLLPVNLLYRDAVSFQAERPAAGLRQALSAVVGSDESRLANGNTVNVSSYISERFREVDSIALIMLYTPSSYPYQGGARYLQVPALITVPRLLWPEKPVLTEGRDFAQMYWQVGAWTQTSIGVTQIGDLYRNFRIWGVMAGMLIWGIAIGAWNRFCQRSDSPRILMVYIYSLVQAVIVIEADFATTLTNAGRTIPLAATVAWVLLPGRDIGPGYRRLLGPRH